MAKLISKFYCFHANSGIMFSITFSLLLAWKYDIFGLLKISTGDEIKSFPRLAFSTSKEVGVAK